MLVLKKQRMMESPAPSDEAARVTPPTARALILAARAAPGWARAAHSAAAVASADFAQRRSMIIPSLAG